MGSGFSWTIIGLFHVLIAGRKHADAGVEMRSLEDKMFRLPKEFGEGSRRFYLSFSQGFDFFQFLFSVVGGSQHAVDFQGTSRLMRRFIRNIPIFTPTSS